MFAGADWQVLYRAFTDVNFNASDPPSINRALREYIQLNYPENFNDWIESSEFVALIDLLSWLGGTLAFKTDINARESFLDTAETRQAILRLARFISYNPRRNQCAQGMVKIVEVMTDDDVMDGFGTNLSNIPIKWDNPDDPDWFERFIMVMNSAYISSNQFGVPLKSGSVADAKTQLYRLNNIMSEANFGFTKTVSGQAMAFELVNSDFDDGGGFYEREPNANNAFHMFYRNDGNGNSSSQTGFFMLFKQGTLKSSQFNIATPVENTIIGIPSANVNDTDVWVQTTTDSGNVIASWNKVPAIFNENITYNNYASTVRNIFSVITLDNDQVNIRFSDGRFGAVPTGNIRVQYRTSNGLQYQIRPADMNRVKITIPYYNRRGVKKNLSVTFSLQSTVSNSTPRESDAQIKARAPSVYATQNRMVSGEDYNTFPLQSNLAVKLKAINRVYSGHSRFIDLNDPTGNYQDVNVFSDDGIFFREEYPLYSEVPSNLNPSSTDIVSLYMQPMLDRQELINHANDYLLTQTSVTANTISNAISWTRATQDSTFTTTGYVSADNTYLKEGATVLFGPTVQDQSPKEPIWATIVSIKGVPTDAPSAGSAGPITLSVTIPSDWVILKIIPRFTSGLNSSITSLAVAAINDHQSFSLWFDYSVSDTPWFIVSSNHTPTTTQFKVMNVNYLSGGLWTINAMGLRYVFESLKNVQWYNDGRRTTDEKTGIAKSDIVRILKTNENLDPAAGGHAFKRNFDLNIDRIYLNRDGSANPRRTTINFADYNFNGYADDPDTFLRVTDPNHVQNFLFWSHDDTYGDSPLTSVVHMFEEEADRVSTILPMGSVAYQINGMSTPYNGTFWVQTSENGEAIGWVLQRVGAYSVGIGRGPNVAYKWYPRRSVDQSQLQNWLIIGTPVPGKPGHYDGRNTSVTTIANSYTSVDSNGNIIFTSKPEDAPFVSADSTFVPTKDQTYTITYKIKKTVAGTNGITSYVKPAFDAYYASNGVLNPALGDKRANFGYVEYLDQANSVNYVDSIDTTNWVLNKVYDVNVTWKPDTDYSSARGRVRINKSYPDDNIGSYPYSDSVYQILGQNIQYANAGVVTLSSSDPISFQWKHYAATDRRVDPARTNIHDIFVLTSEYDYLTRLWIANGSNPTDIPDSPTELDLRLAFESFEDYRMFSDQIVWRPVKYKFLFGNGAEDQLKAKIKVVKLPNSTLSDGEISSQVIRAINNYFDVNLWDFGETFYYTPMAAYIHQQLANIVASVVLVPTASDANFGDGFEIRARSDEIFISTAQVSDVQIITSNTPSNLRIR